MHRSTSRVLATLLMTLILPFNFLVHGRSDTTITATSTIVVATTTITITLSKSSSLAFADPAMSTSTPDAEQSLVRDVMNSTNYYRQAYEASPLSWNSTLASYAKSHAEKCIWEHSGGPYGENLAAGYQSVALAVDGWGDEEGKYNWAKQGFTESTGHFTQVVWKGTTSVGCGLVQCDSQTSNGALGQFLVCEYSPRGNVEGEYQSNVSKSGVGPDGKLGVGGAGRGKDRGELVVSLALAYLCLSAWLSL